EKMLEMDQLFEKPIYGVSTKSNFSKKVYHQKGLKLLVEKIPSLPIFKNIYENLPLEFVTEYLSLRRGQDGWMRVNESFENIEDVNLKRELQWLRSQLHVYLPHTLKLRYNVHYGASANKGDIAAVPYKSARFPDPKSQFTYRDIQANLTVQWMLHEVPSKDIVKEVVKSIMKKYSRDRSEFFAKRWLGKEASVSHLIAILENRAGGDELIKEMQKKFLLRLDIAIELRLPQLRISKEVLRFTNATLTSSGKKCIGLTATPYNVAGMNIQLMSNFKEGDAYNNSRKIIQKSQVKSLPSDLNLFISGVAKKKDSHALVDPSALLVDYTNVEIAKLILSKARECIKQVVFWDDAKDMWMVINHVNRIEEYNEVRHVNKESFFIFDQARSRGTDLPLPKYCTIEILVGKDCPLTSFEQATERGRLIRFGTQKGRFWMEEEINPTVENLFHRVNHNERELIKEELSLMAKREMAEVCNQRLTKKIWDNPNETKELLESYKEIKLHTIDHDNFVLYADLKPPKTISEELEDYEKELIEKYSQLITEEDRRLIRAYRENVVNTIDKDKRCIYEPTLDLRGEEINSVETTDKMNTSYSELELRGENHSQQRTQSQNQALMEKQRKFQQLRLVWNPSDVLPKFMKAAGDIKKIVSNIEGYGVFLSQEVAALYPSAHFPNNLWLSKGVSHISSKCLMDEKEIESSLQKTHLWRTLPKIDYVILFPSMDGKSTGNQYLALSKEEADETDYFMRRSCNHNENLRGITLYKTNGQIISSILNSNKIDPVILMTIAVYNGQIPPSFPNNLLSTCIISRKEIEGKLCFLKKRLQHYRAEEAMSLENNPLTRIFKNLQV
ncbi:MAG: hypothetical protein AAGG81_04795, partial [Chlamydiota bacterium]